MIKKQTTKELLAESFLDLAKDQPVSKITITNITDNCGFSQPTFYNHFKDKYDLILWIQKSRVSEIMMKIGNDGFEWRDTLLAGAEYYAENRYLILNFYKNTKGQDAYIEYVRKLNAEILLKEVRKKLKTEYIPESIYGMIQVYVSGTVHHMFDWLMGDMHLNPEQVAEIWEMSLPEPMKEYLYNE